MPITDLVASISQAPTEQRPAGQTALSQNSKRNAYNAGREAAKNSGMTEMELVLFIEGFRAGLLDKVIG